MAIGIILDLIIIAIVALCVFLSARHGFVRTLIEVIGFIASISIAFTISSPLASVTYDKIIEPSIVSKVDEASADGGNNISQKLWDSFPDLLKNHASDFGLTKEEFDEKVSSSISQSTSESAQKISKTVTKPLIVKLLSAFYSTVITIILITLSKYLAKLINKLFKVSIIGKINAILGGAVGAAKGLVFAFIFCSIVSIIVLLGKDGFWIFTDKNIAASNIFKIIYGFSPFV